MQQVPLRTEEKIRPRTERVNILRTFGFLSRHDGCRDEYGTIQYDTRKSENRPNNEKTESIGEETESFPARWFSPWNLIFAQKGPKL